ncbi:MAG: cellulose biosynthesis cyclic di-GMP-binding regulatory protein BcsB, partial [Clostridia bacterium]|nr:cellulose biosynthesis cyclic di-GMP-binding regulatory protein BcsB [Clostridia bacterium]
MNLSKNKSRLLGFTSVILIMLVIFSFVLAGQGNMRAQAKTYLTPSNSTADDIIIDEILSKERGANAKEVGDKSIFDFNNLTKLFETLTNISNATIDDVKAEMGKSQYNSTKSGDGTYTPNSSIDEYSNAFVGSIHYGMNSEDIRYVTSYDATTGQYDAAARGKNIEVKFGGHVWYVVALTTTGWTEDSNKNRINKVDAGDVVLTLMLKNPIEGYSTVWSGYPNINNPSCSDRYSINVYSTSLARSVLLNGKDSNGIDVKYATNATTLATLTDANRIKDYDKDWAIFTDKNVDKSVTNFLVKPKDVLYTQDENKYDIDTLANVSYQHASMPNDSSLNKIGSGFGGETNKWYPGYNTHYEQEKSVYDQEAKGSKLTYTDGEPLYFDWADDLLWLPSLPETGYDPTYGVNGLWALNEKQCKYVVGSTGVRSWLRSAHVNAPGYTYTINSAGTSALIDRNTVDNKYALRPALYLNLTDAANSAIAKLPTPTDVELEYTGSEQDLDFAKQEGAANWWTTSFKGRVNASYYLGQVPGDPKEPGTYTVKLNLKDSDDTWADGTKDEKTIEYKVIKRKLPFPKWDTTDGGSKPFRGSAGVTFDLYYDGDYLSNLHTLTGKDYFDLVDVTIPTDITKQSGGWKYKAIDAKKYDLTFTLKDTARYEWAKGAPSNGKLPFEVTKKIISVTLTADDGVTDALMGREGSSVNAILTIPPNQIEVGYDAKISIRAQRSGAAPSDVTSVITLNDTSGTENITLDLSDVSANTNLYNLSIDCSSDEYEFVVTNTPTLKVE